MFSELIYVYFHNTKRIHGESWKEFYGFFSTLMMPTGEWNKKVIDTLDAPC
jgi:hypothetical protein